MGIQGRSGTGRDLRRTWSRTRTGQRFDSRISEKMQVCFQASAAPYIDRPKYDTEIRADSTDITAQTC